MQARRKNIERMSEVVPDCDEQALHHFVSNATWDGVAVMNQVALDANKLLGSYTETALLIDESGFEKKGKHSVGVARQWNGRRGKVDNCQVGVFASLGCGRYSTLINSRLYLPKEWTNDARRCYQAHIPAEHSRFKTKPQLALEMVIQAREIGLQYEWVGADGLYGNTPEFLLGLDDLKETFMIDVHKDQRIYVCDPAPTIPKPTSHRGSRPSRLQSSEKTVKVEKLVQDIPEHSWKKITLRDGDKGKLEIEAIHRRIWYWDGQREEAKCWHLIIRREVNSPNEIKYSLSNAKSTTSIERLAHMQGQRFWIERSFQDGKSHCGLGDYQVRGWHGWNHHVALVTVAMLFMLKERMLNENDTPLLSCADIEILLTHFLPRRNTTSAAIIEQMEIRHRKRQTAKKSQMRRQLLSASG